MQELWCEKYRPRTIKEYVFKDEHQKEQILKWIKTKAIPQLIFTGGPGTGKCLGGSEIIDIKLTNTNNKNIQIPIKEFFQKFNIDNIDYDTLVKINVPVYILSPTGYVLINAFVKKQHEVAKYTFNNNQSIICSIKHIVFNNGIPKFIDHCQSIDTVNTPLYIKNVEYLGTQDVYDVALDPPHQYITPNGIIHHNTTLAKILFNELDVNELDILELNASRTNSIDDVRNKIVNFIQTIPFGDFKAVLLDEADFLSMQSQAALRGLLEEYHSNARFIFTANYRNKIIPALHSRCQGFHIEKLDAVEFTAKTAEILIAENIEFNLDVLDTFVKSTYPDLRKCINSLQMNSINGKLVVPDADDTSSSDYRVKMVELFKEGRITDARKLICSQIRAEEIEEIYTWLYSHLEYLGKTDQEQEDAILIIKRGMVDHPLCIDPEINLAATLIKLSRLSTT